MTHQRILLFTSDLKFIDISDEHKLTVMNYVSYKAKKLIGLMYLNEKNEMYQIKDVLKLGYNKRYNKFINWLFFDPIIDVEIVSNRVEGSFTFDFIKQKVKEGVISQRSFIVSGGNYAEIRKRINETKSFEDLFNLYDVLG